MAEALADEQVLVAKIGMAAAVRGQLVAQGSERSLVGGSVVEASVGTPGTLKLGFELETTPPMPFQVTRKLFGMRR